jgi:hypothetical protein
LIHPIDVMGDEGMLGVVQARQQVQVSNDGGLNYIPIEAATMTVREVSIACRWGDIQNKTEDEVKRHGVKAVKASKDDGFEGSFVSFRQACHST